MALAALLEQIWATGLPRTVRVHLCRHAVSVAAGADRRSTSTSAPQPLDDAQGVSDLVKRFGFAGIGEMKRWLSGHSRPDLARRVGKLSKTRNAVAHPDVSLREELLRVLESGAPQQEETHAANTPNRHAESAMLFHIGSDTASTCAEEAGVFTEYCE